MWVSVTGEIWSIHMLEYYSALKRKHVRTPAAAWVELEDTAQEPTQKDMSWLREGSGGERVCDGDGVGAGRRGGPGGAHGCVTCECASGRRAAPQQQLGWGSLLCAFFAIKKEEHVRFPTPLSPKNTAWGGLLKTPFYR